MPAPCLPDDSSIQAGYSRSWLVQPPAVRSFKGDGIEYMNEKFSKEIVTIAFLRMEPRWRGASRRARSCAILRKRAMQENTHHSISGCAPYHRCRSNFFFHLEVFAYKKMLYQRCQPCGDTSLVQCDFNTACIWDIAFLRIS